MRQTDLAAPARNNQTPTAAYHATPAAKPRVLTRDKSPELYAVLCSGSLSNSAMPASIGVYGYSQEGTYEMNPSDLPWWGWFLAAAAAWLVAITIAKWTDTQEGSLLYFVGIGLSILSFISAAVAALIGVIRFIIWVGAGLSSR